MKGNKILGGQEGQLINVQKKVGEHNKPILEDDKEAYILNLK